MSLDDFLTLNTVRLYVAYHVVMVTELVFPGAKDEEGQPAPHPLLADIEKLSSSRATGRWSWLCNGDLVCVLSGFPFTGLTERAELQDTLRISS